ncbi:MAG: hypothetical protein JJ868_01675 [Shimia sp.]|uniref:hypothetical protein n=1 Tax=Shimia sp. TaxID=1954381 RepID=UPI001B179D36|nr:hypothetical protein [Shimia sp.]MBO6896056.1 hypothetical protein [Shimia sp.]
MKISWELPQKRTGFGGVIDGLIGPGATSAEKALQLYLPFAFATAVVLAGGVFDFGWSVIQFVVIAALAVDMMGGVITNATSAAKRWYFREGQGNKQHLGFVAMHVAQIALFGWAFMDLNLLWIGGVFAVLFGFSAVIVTTPLYLQRPIASFLFVVAMFLSLYVFSTPLEVQWFLPMLYYKILISHVLREEPYQPD